MRFKFAIEKIIQNIVPLNVEKIAPLGSNGIKKINRYSNVEEKFALQIRHGKKSKYIGIGKVWNFKYGNYGVLRKNVEYLYNYLNKLKTYL